jgi:DNA-binding protein YbaB
MTREDPYKWFAKTVGEMQERLGKIDELKTALTDIQGESESPDGSVKVTVGPRGAISSLEIRRSAYRLGPQELSDTIVTAIRTASAQAAENLAELLAPVMGNGEQLRSRITGNVAIDDKEIKQSRETLRDLSRTSFGYGAER